MTQRVYYDDGTPPWTWWHTKDIDLDHTSAEVAHGYTLCSLDRLSRIAARRTFGGHISYTDRYWLAYSAMSEHLLAAEGPPTSRDLLRWRSTSWPVMATGIRRCRPACPTWRSRERPRRNSGWCGRRARTSPGTAHPDRWGWRREQQKARPLPGRARRAGGHTDSLREVSASRSRRRTCSLVYPRVSAMSVCLTPRARRVPMTRPRSSRACRTAASAWLIRVTAARSSVMSVSFMGSVSHSVMWPILGMPHEDRQHELWPHAMWRMVGPARGTSPAPSRQGGAP